MDQYRAVNRLSVEEKNSINSLANMQDHCDDHHDNWKKETTILLWNMHILSFTLNC